MDAIKTFQVDQLKVEIFGSQADLSRHVAHVANDYLAEVIRSQGSAAVILATGNSQIQFLHHLIELGGVDWSKLTLFHMDEYLGIDPTHRASFRKYMKERVESKVHPKVFHYLEGDAPLPLDEVERYTKLLKAQPIDLCCMGVGENGHIAFNDPHVARFDDSHWVKLVQLDTECKNQQVKEGHFENLSVVPPYAFTLTIPALCSAKKILCVAPESRKADAVFKALKNPISTDCPASYLRTQPQASLFLDQDSSVRLT